MSNDLISRKETERLLRVYADEVGCNRGEYELANGILKAACFLQNEENIPTAYDVDKVVGQIENCDHRDADGYLEPDSVIGIINISKQINILRRLSTECHNEWKEELEFTLSEAANTIESLSAKLQEVNEIKEQLESLAIEELGITRAQFEMDKREYSSYTSLTLADVLNVLSAANMEWSADGGGWIYCGDGVKLPEEHESIFKKFKGTEKWKEAMFETISNEVEVTVEFEDGTRKTMTAHTLDGKWKVDTFVKNKVIAWKPFSEPYKERN